MAKLRLYSFMAWLYLKIAWSVGRMFGLFLLGGLVILSPLFAFLVWGVVLFILIQQRNFFSGPAAQPNAQTPTENHESPQLAQQIQFWENQRTLQPTDRDILINLSRLYTAQGNTTLADQYLHQAHEVDPNFSF